MIAIVPPKKKTPKKPTKTSRSSTLVPSRTFRVRRGAIRTTTTRAAARVPAATTNASAAKARADQLIGEVRRLQRDISANFYRLGVTLRALKPAEVYGALGHKSFESLLDALELGGRERARQLIEVVDTLPEPLALELGSMKSYEAIRYAELVAPKEPPARVLAADPAVDLDDGEEPIPLSKITSSALAAIVISLRVTGRPTLPGKSTAESATRRLAAQLEATDLDGKSATKRKPKTWVVRADFTPTQANALSAVLEDYRRLRKLLARRK